MESRSSYFHHTLVNVISDGIYPKSEHEADPLELKFLNVSN